MGLERISVGEVVRAPRESLTPGTLISGFTAYDEAISLPEYLAHKLHTGEDRLDYDYYSKNTKANPNRDIVLIDNLAFRNHTHFLGRIVPELALMIPADLSLSPVSEQPNLNPDGLAFLLRYGIWSTGKERPRPYWVVCALFHEIKKPQVWIFGRLGTKDYLNKLIRQSGHEYVEQLTKGRDEIFGS